MSVSPPEDAVVIPEMPGSIDRAAFVERFGPVFEHAAWIAEQAWARRPFADLAAVHRAMVEVVSGSPRETQLALLRGHPELWGPQARARQMTADSAVEQARAGLLTLSTEEAARIDTLNAAHQQKFGFPFIIAVMQNSRTRIFDEFERRLALDAEAEFSACLDQVFTITRLRMERLGRSAAPSIPPGESGGPE